MSDEDRLVYTRLVQAIERESTVNDSILALPNDAELYFLARRRNPVRFYNSALGVQRDDDAVDVIRLLETEPPRLVIFRPNDKYDTALLQRIMSVVRARYVRRGDVEGLEFYARPDEAATATGR